MYSILLNLFLTSYLPSYVTPQILRLLYSYAPLPVPSWVPVLSSPPPPRGSPRLALHHRLTFALLSLIAFFVTFSPSQIEPNYYEILGVYPGADESVLKIAFRSWAKRHHPDRQRGLENGMFQQGREGYEVLRNPLLRFAYERFGPDALKWVNCKTQEEFIKQGLLRAMGYHIASAAALVFLGRLGGKSIISFWRYILFFILLALELRLILSPSPVIASNTATLPSSPSFFRTAFFPNPSLHSHMTLLNVLFPSRVAFQHVKFLHQVFLVGSVTLSRVAPVLFPEVQAEASSDGGKLGITREELRSMIEALRQKGDAIDREVTAMMDTTLQSIRSPENTENNAPLDHETLKKIQRGMEDIMVEQKLRMERDVGPLRSVWEAALRRASLSTRQRQTSTSTHSVAASTTTASTLGPRTGVSEGGLLSPISNNASFSGSIADMDEGPRVKVEPNEALTDSMLHLGSSLPSPSPSPAPDIMESAVFI